MNDKEEKPKEIQYICGCKAPSEVYTIHCPVHRKGIVIVQDTDPGPVDKRHLI